jgi:serine/threonine-protein kinase HipA
LGIISCFDINPIPSSTGLSLNISEHSNALDLDLVREVGEKFRVNEERREAIIAKITQTVSHWREIAAGIGIARSEMERMESAFLRT